MSSNNYFIKLTILAGLLLLSPNLIGAADAALTSLLNAEKVARQNNATKEQLINVAGDIMKRQTELNYEESKGPDGKPLVKRHDGQPSNNKVEKSKNDAANEAKLQAKVYDDPEEFCKDHGKDNTKNEQWCVDYCNGGWKNHESCQDPCEGYNSGPPECSEEVLKPFCDNNPWHKDCRTPETFCDRFPSHENCSEEKFCEIYYTSKRCEDEPEPSPEPELPVTWPPEHAPSSCSRFDGPIQGQVGEPTLPNCRDACPDAPGSSTSESNGCLSDCNDCWEEINKEELCEHEGGTMENGSCVPPPEPSIEPLPGNITAGSDLTCKQFNLEPQNGSLDGNEAFNSNHCSRQCDSYYNEHTNDNEKCFDKSLPSNVRQAYCKRLVDNQNQCREGCKDCFDEKNQCNIDGGQWIDGKCELNPCEQFTCENGGVETIINGKKYCWKLAATGKSCSDTCASPNPDQFGRAWADATCELMPAYPMTDEQMSACATGAQALGKSSNVQHDFWGGTSRCTLKPSGEVVMRYNGYCNANSGTSGTDQRICACRPKCYIYADP